MVAEQNPRYADQVYQNAHDDTFSQPVVKDIPTILPPGVSQEDFNKALDQIASALGEHAVFRGEKLKEYVDPYEIPESVHERNIPGAAVWYAIISKG